MTPKKEKLRKKKVESSVPVVESESQPSFYVWLGGLALFEIILLFVCYAEGMESPFVFDSTPVIAENSSGFFDFEWMKRRRWLAIASFAIDYDLVGLSPWYFFLVNAVIHSLTGLLLFSCVWWTVEAAEQSGRALVSRKSLFSFFAVAIWFVHPLQTQAIVYHVQRMESLMSMFMLLSLLCFIGWLKCEKMKWAWLLAAGVFGVLSAGCKEVGYVTPMLLAIYYFVFKNNFLSPGEHGTNKPNRKLMILVLGIVLLLATVAAYRIVSSNQMGVGGSRFSASLKYFLNQPAVIFFYLRLLLIPIGQNIDHGWAYADSIYQNLLPVSLVTILAIFGLVQVMRRNAIGFLVAGFFVVMAPTSSFVPITDLAVEHRMYLSSILPILFLVAILMRASDWLSGSAQWSAVLLVVWIVFLSYITTQRVEDWRSRKSIWADSINKAPLNARSYFGYANASAANGDQKEAIRFYEKCWELLQEKPIALEYGKGYVNAGSLIIRQADLLAKVGQQKQAIVVLKRILQVDDATSSQLATVGVAIAKTNSMELAQSFFEKGIDVSKNSRESKNVKLKYAESSMKLEMFEKAEGILLGLEQSYPDEWIVLNHLGVIEMLRPNGDQKRAESYFNRAIKLTEDELPRQNLEVLRQR